MRFPVVDYSHKSAPNLLCTVQQTLLNPGSSSDQALHCNADTLEIHCPSCQGLDTSLGPTPSLVGVNFILQGLPDCVAGFCSL